MIQRAAVGYKPWLAAACSRWPVHYVGPKDILLACRDQGALVGQVVVEDQREARLRRDCGILEARLPALSSAVQVDHERQEALLALGEQLTDGDLYGP